MCKRNHLITLSFFVMLGLAPAGCEKKPPEAPFTLEKVSFRLDWKHGVQFLGFYIADMKGFYAEEGLAVDILESGSGRETDEFPAQIERGEIDYGLGSGTLAKALADGRKLTVLANSFQYGPHVFLAKASSGIRTPADLKGRRVVVKSKSWERILERLLAHEGMTLKDIVPVPGGFDMTPFYRGEVDVWSGYLPNEVILARMNGEKVNTLPLHEYAISSLGGSIFTSQAKVEKNRPQAVRFLRGSVRGWRWALENPEKAVDLMLKRFPELAGRRDFHIASFFATIPLVRPPGVEFGSIDCSTWGEEGLFESRSATGEVCDESLIREAQGARP